jgi:hypothetical protein
MNIYSLFYSACIVSVIAILAGFAVSVLSEAVTIGLIVIVMTAIILAFLLEAKNNFKD